MDARRFRDFVNEYGNPGLKITFKGIQSNNDYLDLNEESISVTMIPFHFFEKRGGNQPLQTNDTALY